MTYDEHRENDKKLVDAHIEQLMEHFDTVHIFCTRHMPAELDGTASMNRGGGNWHARAGQIREWVVYQDGVTQEEARKSLQ